MPERFPTIFLPHGGGPWPFLDGDFLHAHDGLAEHLKTIDASIGRRPKAMVVVSAHWDAPVVTVNTAARPPMLYDYFGFPERTYRIEYAAPGSPEVAARVRDLLQSAGIANQSDGERGYDHGVFVPLMLAYPNADVPIVQLSLRSDMDAAAHLAIGRALAPLRDEGVLIVGSGMTFHNMRAFRNPSAQMTQAASDFDAWLATTIANDDGDSDARDRALENWSATPGAPLAHPTPEHLIPLLVTAGAAAGDAASRTFAEPLLGYPASGFRFG